MHVAISKVVATNPSSMDCIILKISPQMQMLLEIAFWTVWSEWVYPLIDALKLLFNLTSSPLLHRKRKEYWLQWMVFLYQQYQTKTNIPQYQGAMSHYVKYVSFAPRVTLPIKQHNCKFAVHNPNQPIDVWAH